jgi:hypothetical protein
VIFASSLKSSIDRGAADAPTPDEPKLILPGCAFAIAMNSFRFFAGNDGCTTKTFGSVPIIAMKAKSRM